MNAQQLMSDNGIECNILPNGHIIRKNNFLSFKRLDNPTYEKALMDAYFNKQIDIEFSKVRVYCQGYESNIHPTKELSDLGIIVLDCEYDSFGPIWFLKIVKTELKLPKWAKYCK